MFRANKNHLESQIKTLRKATPITHAASEISERLRFIYIIKFIYIFLQLSQDIVKVRLLLHDLQRQQSAVGAD